MRPIAVASAATVAVAVGAFILTRRARQRAARQPLEPPPIHDSSACDAIVREPMEDKVGEAETPNTDASSRTKKVITREQEPRILDLDLTAMDEETPSNLSDTMSKRHQESRAALRALESQAWSRARERNADVAAKMAAREEAGIPDAMSSYTAQLLAERRAREAERAARGETEPEAAEPQVEKSRPTHVPPGATVASISAELRRWPKPPAGSAFECTLQPHEWPLYYDHFDWLDDMAATYLFADAAEVLRHLVFLANSETAQVRGCELRAASCGLRAASCELRAPNCELRAASCELQTASCERLSSPLTMVRLPRCR
jgi:hypothetical protein